MTAPHALIVEDEPQLARELRTALLALWPELEIRAEARTGPEALRLLQSAPPDILFVDIRLPGANGLDVARHAGLHTQVVFTTAHDEYAVAAFEQGAVDYVVKPIDITRLATTVARLKSRLQEARVQGGTAPAAAPTRWLQASLGSQLRFITTDSVVYFKSDAKYTKVVTVQAEALIRKSIKELVAELDPVVFWQIHRGTIINIARVRSVDRDVWGRMHVSFHDRPESLQVSETFRARFRQS